MRWRLILFAFFLATTGPAAALEAEFLRAGEAVLGNPHDVALSADGRYLYVADVNKNRVAVLDAETLELAGAFGEGALRALHDVALSTDGKLYIADSRNDRIALYELNGKAGTETGEFTGPFKNPEGVLPLASGALVVTGAWSGNAVVLKGGRVAAQRDDLASPHDIAAGGPGRLWIADAGNDRLLQVDLDLTDVKVLSGPKYGFKGPRYLDLAADGTLWVADKYTHRVLALDPESGDIKTVIGSGEPGKGPGLFTTPEGVAVRGDLLWIADSGNNRVVLYRLSGD